MTVHATEVVHPTFTAIYPLLPPEDLKLMHLLELLIIKNKRQGKNMFKISSWIIQQDQGLFFTDEEVIFNIIVD